MSGSTVATSAKGKRNDARNKSARQNLRFNLLGLSIQLLNGRPSQNTMTPLATEKAISTTNGKTHAGAPVLTLKNRS